ncbi:polycystic kidney disease protein 1-like 2 [Branchiostoma floridae]|uniref:Polycystic kidney disease protein 1-like 2 n=1 Tax=Branchiostoma floridae TaxID=7739 RepID=A0A9J7HU58_BRAFL|nr:polycystic kidney disease protein 1-like 2 [Branchiostoma floridae]
MNQASSTPPIRLPTGDPDENYELEIVIRVTDALGAFSVTRATTNVRPPENIEELVEAVLDDVDVNNLQQTTSSIASVASVLNVAVGTDVDNTKAAYTNTRDRMMQILEQVQVQDVQQVKQVSGTLAHVTNKPEELSDGSQVRAADTLKTLGEVLTTEASEVGTEELEGVAAQLFTGAINILDASSQSVEREKSKTKLTNKTTDFQKNEQAVTTVFETIDELSFTMISRKNRDEKPTLVQAKEFLMSLARSSCDGLGTRVIQTQEKTKAYFEIPENITSKLCVNGTVRSQTYFAPRNPFEYGNNAEDVKTTILGLSVLGERQKVLVSNLKEDERIEYINPISPEKPIIVNGNATSSNSRQIAIHNFTTTEPGVAFYIRVIPDVPNKDVNVTLRTYLKRGAVVSPVDYSHNATLTGNGVSTQPYTWFLNQEALNTGSGREVWTIGLQRIPTTDENGQTSDSSVSYTMSITASKCLFFDESSSLWTDRGCEVGPQTTDEQLHCICDHLTAFAGFVAPNPLDLGSSFTFDLDRSLIALVTVCVVMALYIVAVFIGRSLDVDDKRRREYRRQRKRENRVQQQRVYKNVPQSTTGKSFISEHLWISAVKPPSNHFTRVQRISCCLCLLMSFMLVNIMFYRGDRNFVPRVTGGRVQLEQLFSWDTFIIGLESSLIALPINVIVVVLFRYAGPRHDTSSPANGLIRKGKENYVTPQKDRAVDLPHYLPRRNGTEYTAYPSAHIEKFKKEGGKLHT